MTTKRLYRSRQDRMIAGVCGGIGHYLNIDPTLIRLALLLLAIWGGGGILVYIIAWIVIPEEPVAEAAPPASIVPTEPSVDTAVTEAPPAPTDDR